jgi:hypothetical protein
MVQRKIIVFRAPACIVVLLKNVLYLGAMLQYYMRTITLTFFSVAFFSVFGYCQSEVDIEQWLQPGKHKADIMSIKSNISPRQLELSGKVTRAMKQNEAWFRDSLATAKLDSALIYEKFGLTKDEFDEYSDMPDAKSQKPELIKTGEETLIIKRKKNTLSFQGEGLLKALDSLKFNLTLNVALYNGKQVTFSNKSGSENEDNPFKSPWVGYHYTYDDTEGTDVGDLEKMNLTSVSFDIGHIHNINKVVVMFMAMRIENGKPVQKTTAICMIE